MFSPLPQDDDLDENFVTARNTILGGRSGTMVSAGGAADDTITDLGTLVIVGEPDDAEEMDTMKSEHKFPFSSTFRYKSSLFPVLLLYRSSRF